MTTDRQQRVRELFDEARGLPAGERTTLLDRKCSGAPEIRAEIESLLASYDPSFLEPRSLPRMQGYRVLRHLGSGGMGEVYLAERRRPRQRVAIKVMRRGLEGPDFSARFENERQALALMNHPNIARIYDAGETLEGRPFVVMEYVDGLPLTTYARRYRLGLQERLELFLSVCDGVQHAHQRTIIHRDLKPSNILVSVDADRPIPKIIDFGIAKVMNHQFAEGTLFTEDGQLMGTPEYMSPEQFDLEVHDVDTRTDIYSLGVLLYELLSGTRPFDRTRSGGRIDELRRLIREVDPKLPSARSQAAGESPVQDANEHDDTPSSYARQLLGDLDNITLKALAKDRLRRYGSASDLAADVRLHLEGKPVDVGPPSASYRFGKFVRRHRAASFAVCLVTLSLVLGIVFTSVALRRAWRAEQLARDQATEAIGMSEFHVLMTRGDTVRAEHLAKQCIEEMPAQSAWCHTGLGWLRLEESEIVRAEYHLELAIATWENDPSQVSPQTAHAFGLLALVRAAQGRFDESLSLVHRANEIQGRTLGAEHPSRVPGMLAEARLLLADEPQTAVRLLLEAIRLDVLNFGEDSSFVLQTVEKQRCRLLRHVGIDATQEWLTDVSRLGVRVAELKKKGATGCAPAAPLAWSDEVSVE